MSKNPKVIAVDFDETIGLYRKNTVSKSYITKKVNNFPNDRVVKLIKDLRAKGHRVVVWTSRWWGDYNSLVKWFKNNNIEVDDIVLGRLKADVYVCDKAVNAHDYILEDKVDCLLKNSDKWGIYDKKKRKRVKR